MIDRRSFLRRASVLMAHVAFPQVLTAFLAGCSAKRARVPVFFTAEEMRTLVVLVDLKMGTARMGRDPQTSALNAHNQVHAVPNVYVTDGSCMVSSPPQNPSLTYMALTARAANHAVEQLRRGDL